MINPINEEIDLKEFNKPPKDGEYNFSYRPGEKKLYRYQQMMLGSGDDDYDYINLEIYNVIRETRCKYVICQWGKDKLVDKFAYKRYAYPTKEEAWISLEKRMKCWKAWAALSHDKAQRAIDMIVKRNMEKLK